MIIILNCFLFVFLIPFKLQNLSWVCSFKQFEQRHTDSQNWAHFNLVIELNFQLSKEKKTTMKNKRRRKNYTQIHITTKLFVETCKVLIQSIEIKYSIFNTNQRKQKLYLKSTKKIFKTKWNKRKWNTNKRSPEMHHIH